MIQAGGLMLYQSNSLVLFYRSSSTPYSYTPVGKLADMSGLAEALDTGNVTITFLL
jgi:cyclophilin-like protein